MKQSEVEKTIELLLSAVLSAQTTCAHQGPHPHLPSSLTVSTHTPTTIPRTLYLSQVSRLSVLPSSNSSEPTISDNNQRNPKLPQCFFILRYVKSMYIVLMKNTLVCVRDNGALIVVERALALWCSVHSFSSEWVLHKIIQVAVWGILFIVYFISRTFSVIT